MLRHVAQTTEHGCGAAALAMLLGLDTQEEAERVMGRPVEAEIGDGEHPVVGYTPQEIAARLFERSVLAYHYMGPMMWAPGGWRGAATDSGHLREKTLDDIWDWTQAGGAALLAVGSRTRADWQHWVIRCGRRTLDPGRDPERRYGDRDQLDVWEGLLVDYRHALLHQWVFNEGERSIGWARGHVDPALRTVQLDADGPRVVWLASDCRPVTREEARLYDLEGVGV